MVVEYLLADSEFHNPLLKMNDQDKQRKVTSLLEEYKLSKERVQRVKNVFYEEMKSGLSSDAKRKACLQMENTFITCLPTGDEKGAFLSLDLGSTNFRVLLSKLKGESEEDEFIVKYYDIPLEIKIGNSAKLFDLIADCIGDFLSSVPELNTQRIPLGFTFSFPMVQKAIDVGLLITWTKCYDLPDVVGKNAVEFLQKALNERKLNVDVVAILNDTTGTLVKGAYLDKDCAIGLILGTGFNACYVEKVEKVEKWVENKPHKHVANVLIDIECGAFGDDGCIDFIKTDVDKELDNDSLFVGSFAFEKLFSGNFVGDLVRRVMLRLSSQKLLFSEGCKKLEEKDTVSAAHVSAIEGQHNGNKETRKFIESLGYMNYTEEDVAIVEYICAVISVRGALLVSILMAQLIEHIDRENVSIAIDGSLYNHPKYKKLLNDFISNLAPGKKFKLITAKDGSGKGAGLVAAIVQKMRENNR